MLLHTLLYVFLILQRLRVHLRNANVPGLGLGLEEIDRTYVVVSSNERSLCTDVL